MPRKNTLIEIFYKIINFIKYSIKSEQRKTLYYNKSKLDEEEKNIKKYIFMTFVMVIFVDLLIFKMNYLLIYIFINTLLAPIIVFNLYKLEVKSKFDLSYRKVHMELPSILQQIYCLLSIDHSLEESIKESSANLSSEILKKELDDMYNRLSRGYDLNFVLDNFFNEMSSQYILRLRSTLISHYYYGGSDTKESFIDLIYDLLEYRVLLLREDGERIKVKLVIPIIMIFISTILSLALPILLNLSM